MRDHFSPNMVVGLDDLKAAGFVAKENSEDNEPTLRELAFSLDVDMTAFKGSIEMIKDIEEELYYIREQMDQININLDAKTPDIMRMFLRFKELYRPIRMLNESLYYTTQDLDRNFVRSRARVDAFFDQVVKQKRNIDGRE